MLTADIHWDPNPIAFHIPWLRHPVVWYGVLFAIGFAVGCLVTRRVVVRYLADSYPDLSPSEPRRLASTYTDRLLGFTIVGTVVGARLGHVLFYDLHTYLANPIEIFKIWQGGLASHGAAIGVVVSLIAFQIGIKPPLPRYSLLRLLDITVIPTTLIGSFIRLGNFMNQELVGIPTRVPWAVFFAHPLDGVPAMARHPVQIYESLAYLVGFILLYRLGRHHEVRNSTGLLAGLFFLWVFGARFWLEFFKEQQSTLLGQQAWLDMGQLLSLPFIGIGSFLIIRCIRQAKKQKDS